MASRDSLASDGSAFHPTRWTLVERSRGDSPEAREALSELCGACYAPVVAFLRREGRDENAARDLAHEFFAEVLAEASLARVERQHGRFRSYLLGAVKHFLANRRRHDARLKRGGDAQPVPLDASTDTSPGLDIGRDGAPARCRVRPRMGADHRRTRAGGIAKRVRRGPRRAV